MMTIYSFFNQRVILFCPNRKEPKESQTFRLIEVRMRFLGAIGSPTGVFAHTQKPPRNTRRWKESTDFSWRVNILRKLKICAESHFYEQTHGDKL